MAHVDGHVTIDHDVDRGAVAVAVGNRPRRDQAQALVSPRSDRRVVLRESSRETIDRRLDAAVTSIDSGTMGIPADTTIEALLRKNAELLRALAERDAQVDILVKTVGAKQDEIERLQHKLQALIHRLWGRRSEKGAPGQLMLFQDDSNEQESAKPDVAPDA